MACTHVKPQTKEGRHEGLKSGNNLDHSLKNPCDSPMIRKSYRIRVVSKWKIIEKDTVDEIIFRTSNTRNRLMLERMVRGGRLICGDIPQPTPHDRVSPSRS